MADFNFRSRVGLGCQLVKQVEALNTFLAPCLLPASYRLSDTVVTVQLLALLQSMAAAACNCRAESYCVSCGVLLDGGSSLLHSVCMCVYVQPKQITQATKMAVVSPVA